MRRRFFCSIHGYTVGGGEFPLVLAGNLMHGQNNLLELVFVFQPARGSSHFLNNAQ